MIAKISPLIEQFVLNIHLVEKAIRKHSQVGLLGKKWQTEYGSANSAVNY